MTRSSVVLVAALLVVSVLAGCVDWGKTASAEAVEAPDWRVGDTWVYARTGPSGDELVYERKVNALFMHGSNLVFELKSGLRNDPKQDYHLYRTDDLRFVGSDLRDGSHLLKRVTAEEPIEFHYLFPLVPGDELETQGLLHQKVAGHDQSDPVTITATVGEPRDLALGERTYEVVPYEIRIRYESTPFEDEAVIEGNWAPAVEQSVLTFIHEGGQSVRQELLYFERQEPEPGLPAYDLLPPLASRSLERGFEARLGESGWQRYLFHVEDPVRIGVSVTVPSATQEKDRLDVVSLRPLGFTRAGIADQLVDLATGGLFLHVSATQDGDVVHHHAAQGSGNDMVYLQPGQVYELIVASNVGKLGVRVDHTHESQGFAPAQQGRVEVLSGSHQQVEQTMEPGPQSVSDGLDAKIDNPDGERIEGVVYAMNHGAGEETLVDLDGRREVFLSVDGWSWRDDKELYAYYFGYVPRDGFQLFTGFEYQATLAVQSTVEYELGVLLLRLLPP